MSLAGDLREISFSELLQLCSKIKRSGALALHRPDEDEPVGLFHFENGELIDATLGEARGADAVYGALQLREGSFHFHVDVQSGPRRIHVPVSALLVEGIQRIDGAARRSGVPLEPAPASDSGPFSEAAMASPRSQPPPLPPAMGAAGPPAVPLEVGASGELEGDDGDGVRLCPVCNRAFRTGETCPDDGATLLTAADTRNGVTLQLPSIPPRAAALLGPRPGDPPTPAPARSSSWLWVAAVGVVGVFIAVPVISTHQPSRPAASESIALPPSTPPASLVAGAPPQAQGAAPAPAAQAEPAAPAVQGVSDKEILFGMAAPFSGPARELGRQMKLGVDAAFAALNEAGGIHGRQLRLVSIDDGYEPTRTAEAMKALYEKQKIFGVIGNVGTPTAAVALPYALERKMLFFAPFSGASLLRNSPPDRYVFNFRASYAEETAAVVKHLLKVRHLRPDQIAVFAQQDSFGDSGYAGVAKALRTLAPDATPVLRVGYKRNTIDVDDAVRRIRFQRRVVRAVVMVATYRAAAKFIEKMREILPDTIFSNVSFVGSTALADELKLINPKLGAGVIVTQVVPPVDSYSTAVLKYKESLARIAPGENPDFVSLEGYLAANLLAEGVRRAGRDLDTEKLVDVFEGLSQHDLGVGISVSFNSLDHQSVHKVWGTVLDDTGRYQAIDLD